MKVVLLQCPTNLEVSEIAAATCVGKTHNPTQVGLQHAIQSGHLSVLEHLSYSFLVEGVSRSLTHQLVRHRIASYSQMSQRYCKVNVNSDDWYITPPSIAKSSNLIIYIRCMENIARAYQLLSETIPKEDARFILPNACSSSIVVTVNARALIEQSEKRLCNKAQWEIRELYKTMVKLVREQTPEIAELCKPPCMKGGCKELKPCGVPWNE